MKRFPIIILVIMLCLALMPVKPLAASAQCIQEQLEVFSTNIPDDAEYLDVLIKMDEDDPYYTPCNEENMKQYSFDKTTLAEYSTDGFVSLSYHYYVPEKTLYTDMKINKTRYNEIDRTWNTFSSYNDETYYSLFNGKRVIRIAVLDKDGNIIQVSKSIKMTGKKGRVNSSIDYNIGKNKLEYEYEDEQNPSLLELLLILLLLPIIILWSISPWLGFNFIAILLVSSGGMIILIERAIIKAAKRRKNKKSET